MPGIPGEPGEKGEPGVGIRGPPVRVFYIIKLLPRLDFIWGISFTKIQVNKSLLQVVLLVLWFKGFVIMIELI